MAAESTRLPFAEVPEVVDVYFGSPERQRRWTVAIRALLVLPQVVVLTLLCLLSAILSVVGWFAALVLGRLTRRIASYQTQVLGYAMRVSAYTWLLVDAYPPFRFRSVSYPVEIRVRPTRVRRLAVLFRLILVIPAYVVVSLLSGGMSVLAVFVWLVVLVRGQMPRPLFGAFAASLRYQSRLFAYLLLLTSAYPRNLFGEEALPGFEDRERRRLVLSTFSKGLLVLILVLGVVYQVGYGSFVYTHLRNSPGPTASAVANAYGGLVSAITAFQGRTAQCRSTTSPLHCVQRNEPRTAAAFDRFAAALVKIRFQAGDQPAAAAAERDARTMASTFRAISRAPTTAAYLRDAIPLVTLGQRLDAEVKKLLVAG